MLENFAGFHAGARKECATLYADGGGRIPTLPESSFRYELCKYVTVTIYMIYDFARAFNRINSAPINATIGKQASRKKRVGDLFFNFYASLKFDKVF